MAKYLIEDTTLSNISTAIRQNNTVSPKEQLITPEEMPLKISEVYVTGELDGRGAGYTLGLEEGVAQGKKSQHDEFWDSFQKNGERTVYTASFGSGWNANNFKPKYSMHPTHAQYMFWNNMTQFIYIPDFVEFCNDRGIVLDFSNCTNVYSALATLHTKHFGVLDFSKATNLQSVFYTHDSSWATYNVETIDELISSETTVFRSDTFKNATYLTNLTMSGVIATGSFDVSTCTLLTHDSLMSIINCLKDVSSEGTTKTCTLGATNLAKLTDEEKAIATQKGWTLA